MHTSLDIACCRREVLPTTLEKAQENHHAANKSESVPPKILEPLLSQTNKGQSRTRENIARQLYLFKNPETIMENPEEIIWDELSSSHEKD